jgi:phage shock protein A
MRNALNLCGCLLLSAAVLLACAGAARAGLIGDTLAEAGVSDEQVQIAGDALYNAATAAAIGGKRGAESGRGISGALGDLALNSGEITCSLWLIQLRSHFRNLISTTERARALGEDPAEIARLDDLIAKTQDFALKLEAACTKVGWLIQDPAPEWKTVNRLKSAVGLGPAADKAPTTPAPPAPPAPPPLPEGGNAADLQCRNVCSGIFEAYANALANSRNKYAEADRLRKGELADATRNEARAESNLKEVRANPRMDPRNIRRDELALEKASAATAQAQARVDRVTAEGDALARRSQDLLERLKECVKGCRKQMKDMSGLDATRIDTYFTGQVRDGGSAQDAQRYTTLSGDPGNRTATAKPSAKLVAKPLPKGVPDPVPKPKPVAVGKDGPPAVKDGTGGEPPKIAPDKAGAASPQTSILDTIDDGKFRQQAGQADALTAAACPKCAALADRLALLTKALAEEDVKLARYRRLYYDAMAEREKSKDINDPAQVKWWIELAAAGEEMIRRQAVKVEGVERAVEDLRRQLADCNKTCVPPPAAKVVDPPPPPTKPAIATGAAPQAYCPACDARQQAVVRKQAEIDAANAVLDKMRAGYTDAVVKSGQDTRVSNDPAAIKQAMDLVAQVEASIQRQGDKVRKLEQDMEPLQRSLAECNKTCAPPPAPKVVDPPPKAAVSTGCYFDMPKPITIGPKATYGITDDLAKSVAAAAGGFLGGRTGMGGSSSGGGMFGGGMMGGGPMGGGSALPPSGPDKPKLATDPVRDKQKFTEPTTGTVIQVGSQYRPDGKLLVSIGIDNAADKGVVHQAALERVQYLPSGECGKQAIEPVEWVHYSIWEDWWAKIRIRTYVSVDGGPWRQTSDTGWQDWGSGSRLIESGTMKADQIPGTAWGSMGADRAFGGPRSAGAVFNAGKPIVVDKPAPERLVIHITQPGKDPVSTVPFALYPTYSMTGGVKYTDKQPDFSEFFRHQKLDDGGMQTIDPPATGPAQPQGSILDSIDTSIKTMPMR